MRTHKDLTIWQISVDFVTQIYNLTKLFPIEERFGLTSQIQRSAVSIPSNIAEGAARNSDKEFLHFLSISMGSLSELETQLIIARNIEYLDQKHHDAINNQLTTIRKMLLGLQKSIRNKTNPNS